MYQFHIGWHLTFYIKTFLGREYDHKHFARVTKTWLRLCMYNMRMLHLGIIFLLVDLFAS